MMSNQYNREYDWFNQLVLTEIVDENPTI